MEERGNFPVSSIRFFVIRPVWQILDKRASIPRGGRPFFSASCRCAIRLLSMRHPFAVDAPSVCCRCAIRSLAIHRPFVGDISFVCWRYIVCLVVIYQPIRKNFTPEMRSFMPVIWI